MLSVIYSVGCFFRGDNTLTYHDQSCKQYETAALLMMKSMKTRCVENRQKAKRL